MQAELKRIFVKELPDNCNELDVHKKFSKFGDVSSVEIKQRKPVGNQYENKNFAFVNINIDPVSLQNCFKDISNVPWRGKYVEIQLAKESFLDRLKKEREQSQVKLPEEKVKYNEDNIKDFNVKKRKLDEHVNKDHIESPIIPNGNSINAVEDVNLEEVYAGMKVKSNKNVTLNNKIESFGFDPIIKIEPKKPKSKDPKRAEADQKRINSMLEMKRSYQQQKFAIKHALSKIDLNPSQPKEKVEQKQQFEKQSKQPLFEDDGSEEEDNLNINLKEQFQGKKGEELFKLQAKFNHDNRFKIDERFAEDDNEEREVDGVNDEEEKKQLEILGDVLGTKALTVKNKDEQAGKLMLRFDPAQPSHSKYEIKAQKEKKRKCTDRLSDTNQPISKEVAKNNVNVQENIPEVSKDTFFEVTDILKESLKEKESFSLINMFGNNYEDEQEEEAVCEPTIKTKPQIENGTNAFRYDSSTDEEGNDDNKHLEDITVKDSETNDTQKVDMGPAKLWTEPFFFRKDDFRLQEGLDFLKRMASDDSTDFKEVRREVKFITKHKIKLSEQKDNRFRKKLGGAKKKFKRKNNFR